MSTTEAATDAVDQALQSLITALDELDREAKLHQDALDELEPKRRRLRSAIQQLKGANAGPGLTGRVLDLLRDAAGPLHVTEIAETLDLDISQVRSAIGYLKRKGEVNNVGRGRWRANPAGHREGSGAQ